MKYITNRLFTLVVSILGGIFIMTTLSACNTDNIPENRTKEEYNVENSFQPVFDFLEEDPKDFSNVESFSSWIFIQSLGSENSEEIFGFSVKESENKLSGTYSVTENSTETTYPIFLTRNGDLEFQGEVPQESLLSLLIQTVKKAEFENLTISDVMAEHPETDMRTITYNVEANHPILKETVNHFNIQNIEFADISLTWRGDSNYTIQLTISNKEMLYSIIQNLTFKQ